MVHLHTVPERTRLANKLVCIKEKGTTMWAWWWGKHTFTRLSHFLLTCSCPFSRILFQAAGNYTNVYMYIYISTQATSSLLHCICMEHLRQNWWGYWAYPTTALRLCIAKSNVQYHSTAWSGHSLIAVHQVLTRAFFFPRMHSMPEQVSLLHHLMKHSESSS